MYENPKRNTESTSLLLREDWDKLAFGEGPLNPGNSTTSRRKGRSGPTATLHILMTGIMTKLDGIGHSSTQIPSIS